MINENNLRPNNFDGYIGNTDLVAKLKIAIAAAKKRNGPMPHIMLSGPAGIGKTSLAMIIAKEFGLTPKVINGSSVENAADILQILIKLKENDVLFIDECHRMNIKTEEHLYPVLEDFRIDIKTGVFNASLKSIPIKPFCMIAATTRPGDLSKPLIDRFGIIHNLSFYSINELKQILSKNAEKMRISSVSDDALIDICKRSRGTPRIALRLLSRARDYADIKSSGKITMPSLKEAMKLEMIDEMGLNPADIKYLQLLSHGGLIIKPVGLKTIASALGEDTSTVENNIEPYLIQLGFVEKQSKGRLITDKGLEYLFK